MRQAALQASWRRDRRVAQRRIAWRWTVWYVQRYALHALVALVLLAGTAYFSGMLRPWHWGGDTMMSTARPSPARASYAPPSVTTVPVGATVVTTVPDDRPLVLHANPRLVTHPAKATLARDAVTAPDTLSLKPENWLHSKEP